MVRNFGAYPSSEMSNDYFVTFHYFHNESNTCNLKTIAFREFWVNVLLAYFWVSYNIVKLQTSSLLHS